MVSPADILNARILIVDDLDANVRLLQGMLRIAGYTSVESTTDPHQVCELHRKRRYALILLDLKMPGMDGFQVMEGLKEIEEDGYLPVLVITAQPDQKLRALEAGAKDFVGKPFELAELRARVHNILEVRLLHLEAKNYSKVLEETVRELEASREVIRLKNLAERRNGCKAHWRDRRTSRRAGGSGALAKASHCARRNRPGKIRREAGNAPAGVAWSPFRLSRLIRPMPSAQQITSGPALSRPAQIPSPMPRPAGASRRGGGDFAWPLAAPRRISRGQTREPAPSIRHEDFKIRGDFFAPAPRQTRPADGPRLFRP